MTPSKKIVHVVAALIEKDGRIFSAARGYGFLKGKWELPGGKIEPGETKEQALVREIKEELDTDIQIDSFFQHILYEYDEFILDMDVFKCHLLKGRLDIEKGIHLAEAWFKPEELNANDWCPADQEIVAKIKATK